MDVRQLSLLLIRLGGLLLLIRSIFGLGQVLLSFVLIPDPWFESWSLFTLSVWFLPLLAGFLLWTYPGSIANRILGEAVDKDLYPKLMSQVETIAISLLGLYLLFHAVSELAYDGTILWRTKNQLEMKMTISNDTMASMVVSGVKFVIGLWFIIRARGMVRLFQWLRS